MDLRNKFADFDGKPGRYFKQAHIHHQCVYVGLDRICVYLEYSGGDFANDDKKLNSHEKVVQWNEDVGRFLKEPWKEMREVFYTD